MKTSSKTNVNVKDLNHKHLLHYDFHYCFLRLQKLIIDRYENKISKLRFSQKKLDVLEKEISEFKLNYIGNENLN